MRLIAVILSFVLMVGCATPRVIDERRVGDRALSCSQIKDEIYDAERFADKAKDEQRVTGTNVAAAILFWPALLVTYSNVQEALGAATDRKEYLVRLADKKDCGL